MVVQILYDCICKNKVCAYKVYNYYIVAIPHTGDRSQITMNCAVFVSEPFLVIAIPLRYTHHINFNEYVIIYIYACIIQKKT